MMLGLDRYLTMIFDCDGVILDSNQIKAEAFRTAAKSYGDAAAQAMVDYHIAHGGISRYVKFAYFLDHIVPEYAPPRSGPDLDELLETFADAVLKGLMSCPVAKGLDRLRSATPQANWLIVSGGDQDELREVFASRSIAKYFDGGIFGSPDTKNAILSRELDNRNIRRPAIFFGDSRLDQAAAKQADLDFVFVADWSEWIDGARLANQGRFPMVKTINDFVEK
jgi:phosphoglycolate phosphatase-like HAD superfamily hydrolase